MPDGVGREVVLEAFKRHGVKVSEDDPVVVVGTVLELGMDRAVSSASIGVAAAVDKSLVAGFARFQKELDSTAASSKAASEAAGYRAEQAVKRALSITPDTRWKFFGMGVLVGAGAVLLGLLAQAWLRVSL